MRSNENQLKLATKFIDPKKAYESEADIASTDDTASVLTYKH
jgi:hypothetical protein